MTIDDRSSSGGYGATTMTPTPTPTFLLNSALAASHLSSLTLPSSSADVQELRKLLEKGTEVEKLDAMKAVLACLSTMTTTTSTTLSPKTYFYGQLGPLLMTIIRFVLPNQKNKFLKKLVLLFFEVVPKINEDGKLLPEMILVCNALRTDLLHPNEWIRGITLRFLTRLGPYPELLESLIGSIRAGLNDPHPYVKKMAIAAIHHLHSTPALEHLVSEAPELLEDLLLNSTTTAIAQDPSIQRHAFLSLALEDPASAKRWLETEGFFLLKEPATATTTTTTTFASSPKTNLQTLLLNWLASSTATATANTTERDVIVHLLVDRLASSQGFQEIDAIFTLLQSSTNTTTTTTKEDETIIPLLFKTSITYILSKGDISQKTYVLNLLSTLPSRKLRLLPCSALLPLLGVLSTSNTSLKTPLLSLLSREEDWLDYGASLDLVDVLGDEMRQNCSSTSTTATGSNSYLLMIIKVLGGIVQRFPGSSERVMKTLFSFIVGAGALVPEELFGLMEQMLKKSPSLISLIDLRSLKWSESSSMARILYILAVFCTTSNKHLHVLEMLEDVMVAFSDLSLCASPTTRSTTTTTNVIGADGTYVRVENENISDHHRHTEEEEQQRSRYPITSALYYCDKWDVAIACGVLLSVLASCDVGDDQQPNRSHRCLALLSYLIDYATTARTSVPDEDSLERLLVIRNVISSSSTFNVSSASSSPADLTIMPGNNSLTTKSSVNVDAEIDYGFYGGGGAGVKPTKTIKSASSITSMLEHPKSTKTASLGVGRIQQLSGLCDEVYCETLIEVKGSLVMLDILVVNRRDRNLLSLTLDLFSNNSGLSCLERPNVIDVLEVGGWREMKALFMVDNKVASFLVFGSCTYEVGGSGHVDASRQNCIVMNPISLDICEWILPSASSLGMTSTFFREMWPKLEWENKVLIPMIKVSGSITNNNNNNISNAKKNALKHVFRSLLDPLKFTSLTPNDGISGGGDYLAANIFSSSVFDELILANVCLETVEVDGDDLTGDGCIVVVVNGHLRLRSKEQGIAVALGDRLGEIVTSMKD